MNSLNIKRHSDRIRLDSAQEDPSVHEDEAAANQMFRIQPHDIGTSTVPVVQEGEEAEGEGEGEEDKHEEEDTYSTTIEDTVHSVANRALRHEEGATGPTTIEEGTRTFISILRFMQMPSESF